MTTLFLLSLFVLLGLVMYAFGKKLNDDNVICIDVEKLISMLKATKGNKKPNTLANVEGCFNIDYKKLMEAYNKKNGRNTLDAETQG